jgi:hypothetical protein
MDSSRARHTGTNIVHFPEDRSLGTLYACDPSDTGKTFHYWDRVGDACGNIAVPEGQAIGFQAAESFSDTDLALLHAITEIHVLSLGRCGITDAGLHYLADFPSLESLTLAS